MSSGRRYRNEVDALLGQSLQHMKEATMSLPAPETIVEMVAGLVEGMDAGPSIVCLPVDYGTLLDREHPTKIGVGTLRMQLLKVPNIKGIELHSGKGVYLKAVQ